MQELLNAKEEENNDNNFENFGQIKYQNNENIHQVSQKPSVKESKGSNEIESKKERIFTEKSQDELNHTGNSKEYGKNDHKIVAEKPTPITQNVNSAPEEAVHLDDGNDDFSLVFLEKIPWSRKWKCWDSSRIWRNERENI